MQPQQPAPQISFDEYVGMSGAAKAWGAERMCGYYRIVPATWTAIQALWQPTVGTNAHFQPMVDQEAARLQMGGQPRTVSAFAFRELEQVGNALGNLFGGVAKAIAPPGVGTPVLVQWSDGQRYPGTVAEVGAGQYLVTMANGQKHWVPAAFVTLP